MALFAKAEACHQPSKKKQCPFHSTPEEKDHQDEKEKKGCCSDQTEYLKTDQEQLNQSFEFELQLNPVLLNNLFVVQSFELPSIDTQTLHYLNYKPPLIVCDFSISLQIFRC